ncbi:MAG: hypothetical protein Q4D71_08560 [Oscillospiraceae bacterium]|nr:hypothetical protein [Oscillospiraceae bacterium]
MTTKVRILSSRLLEKIDRKPEYARQLGITAHGRIGKSILEKENKTVIKKEG